MNAWIIFWNVGEIPSTSLSALVQLGKNKYQILEVWKSSEFKLKTILRGLSGQIGVFRYFPLGEPEQVPKDFDWEKIETDKEIVKAIERLHKKGVLEEARINLLPN